jgi:hypothetical protein
MKGTVFQKPFEFNLRVEGETWAQGDPISGSLIIKNHGNESILLSDTRVLLGYADLKHVHAKTPDAFEILQTVTVSQPQLEAGKELTVPWQFQTDRNCPITDNLASLFLLYGSGTAYEKVGQLQLKVTPYLVITEFLNVLQVNFRFVVKTQKFSKKAVEIKMAPPDGARAFANVEQLVLRFSFQGEELEVEYAFKVKKLEATATSMAMTKQSKTSAQTYRPDQYRTSSGRFNHDEVEAGIREALSPFEVKI